MVINSRENDMTYKTNSIQYLYITEYDNILIKGESFNEAIRNLRGLKKKYKDFPKGDLYVKCLMTGYSY